VHVGAAVDDNMGLSAVAPAIGLMRVTTEKVCIVANIL
jgi:hypothetical protein